MDPRTVQQNDTSPNIVDQIIDHLHSPPRADGGQVRYPGERVLQIRKENLANGVPVEPSIWHEVQKLI
jgi:3-dehydro-L-gulonate 2-dehydrogenase